MKRIMVIGNCGSGKSTLARKIQSITNLPLIHLDKEHWSPGWVEPDKTAWTNRVTELSDQAEWIIDGNFGSTMEIRMQRADTIVLMETSTLKSLLRVVKRNIQYWGRTRPDMTEGCVEKLDPGFLHYVISYNFLRRPRNRELIKKYAEGRQVFLIKKSSDETSLLAALESSIV